MCILVFIFSFIFFFKQKTAYEIGLGIPAEPSFRSYDATPFNQILKQYAKREMRLRLGKVTVADVLAAQPVTTNLLKFMRASIKMIGVSNLQSFIASMTQKLTLSDISDESKNYLDKAGITTACLRIKSKWTAGGK